MERIPQKELRNNVGEVLRRAEAGEEFEVTVSGRPVAKVVPLQKRAVVSAKLFRQIYLSPTDETWLDDIRSFEADLADPFELFG